MSDRGIIHGAARPSTGSKELLGVLRPLGTNAHLLVHAEKLAKSYGIVGTRRLLLFEELTFSVRSGEILAIVGQSGAGKSTLLHMLGALDRPTAGTIRCGEVQVDTLRGSAAARFRNRDVGYVWQFHYLLPEFSAVENVAMPLLARGIARRAAETKAAEWLGRVGLGDRISHRAGELSGGEQQRVSLARALITEPKLLLADEPTGDLDGDSAESVFRLLEELHKEAGLTTVLVTHNMTLAAHCHRVLRLTQGSMIEVAANDL